MRSAMAEALHDLQDFLAKFAVHADVFSKNTDEQPAGMEMATVADLSGYFTATECEDRVQTEILDGTSQASDRLQRARLRAAWVKAKEVISTAAAPPQQLQKHDDDALPELGIPTKASSGTKRRQEPRFADDFCADWNLGQCTKKANDCPHTTRLAAATLRRTASSVASGSTQPRCTRNGFPQMKGHVKLRRMAL